MRVASITVPSELVVLFEQILHSGMRGTHLLFTTSTIRAAFDSIDDPVVDWSRPALNNNLQEALLKLLSMDDPDRRYQVVANLDEPLRNMLVHLYFGILEHAQTTRRRKPGVLH